MFLNGMAVQPHTGRCTTDFSPGESDLGACQEVEFLVAYDICRVEVAPCLYHHQSQIACFISGSKVIKIPAPVLHCMLKSLMPDAICQILEIIAHIIQEKSSLPQNLQVGRSHHREVRAGRDPRCRVSRLARGR